MRRRPVSTVEARPIVTLTTDFGTRDFYVAAMKAALLRACPHARLIDVTHEVAPQDVLCGAIMLERAVDGFPPGTIHLAVIDPGVGTARRLLIAELNRQTIVCPDNGLITWAWRRLGPGQASELTWRPASASNTFHGRDVMAPVAGMLACGKPVRSLASSISDPVLLDVEPARSPADAVRIIHVDHYGNATTNLLAAALGGAEAQGVRIGLHDVGAVRRTYADVGPGQPLALIGSSGLLEIAVRDGSAATELNIEVGDRVQLSIINAPVNKIHQPRSDDRI